MTVKTTYFYNAISEESAHKVENWPWGYKLRTTKLFWIETKEKHGQRLCTRTINPKTGRWCAIKKTTYSPILFVVEQSDEKGGINTTCTGLDSYAENESIQKFMETHKDHLSAYQLAWCKLRLKLNDKYDELSKEREEKIKERDAAPKIPENDLMEKFVIRSERELRSINTSFKVFSLSLRVKGIKKRCRKTESHFEKVGYVPKNPLTPVQIEEIKEAAHLMIVDKFKSYQSAHLVITPAEYEAPREGSIFSGIKQNLFDSNAVRINLDEKREERSA